MVEFPKFLRTASFTLFLVAAGGCSATDHTTAVTRFAVATVAAETALKGIDQAIMERERTALEQRLLSDQSPAVTNREDECGGETIRCRIEIHLTNPDNNDERLPPEVFPPDSRLDNMIDVMGGIRAYAQNLAAILADDSAAEAKASINAALGSIESLASTVVKAGGNETSPDPDFATSVGAGVNWLVGQYADRVKLEGLREATGAANPVIQEAARVFADTNDQASLVLGEVLRDDFQERVDAFNLNVQDINARRSNYAAVVNAAATYDRFIVSKDNAIFARMGEAHAALTEGLDDPDDSLVEMFRKIEAFAAAAEELAAIVANLAAMAGEE